MEFIRLDENQKFWYFGECKITINTLSKQLIVEPIDEELKMMSADFNHNMVQKKNILFLFQHPSQEKLNFVLIFINEEKCSTVFNIVKKYKDTTQENETLDFLLPFWECIQANEDLKAQMKQKLDFLWKLFPSSNVKMEQQPPLKSEENILNLKDKNEENSEIEADVKNIDLENSAEIQQTKKRRLRRECSQKNKRIVKKPNFDLIFFKENGISKSRLFIFPNSDKKYCYEYYWDNSRKYYLCCGCDSCKQRNQAKAEIVKGKNKEEYVKLGERGHVCELRKYKPEKYKELKIITKHDYLLLKRRWQGKIIDKLIIFDENDRSLCHEYTLNGYRYYCYDCATQYKIQVSARLLTNENGEEYVELKRNEHSCELQKFVPENLSANIITSENFIKDITATNGKERERLVIFDQNNKGLCYIYHNRLNRSREYWKCFGCMKKHESVSARLFENENGEKCVELSEKPHLCTPQKYVPTATKIIKAPDFTVYYEHQNKQQPKSLVVYDSTNKDLCRTYSWHPCLKKFKCKKCQKLRKSVVALLKKDENGENYIVLSSYEHVCKPDQVSELKAILLTHGYYHFGKK